MKKIFPKPLRSVVSMTVLGLLATHAQAGGFSLYTEASPAGVGNYAAGAAAEAFDASTGWYNPAGLVLIPEQQAVVGGVGVFPSSKITGSSTFSSPTLPVPSARNYVQTFSGLDGARDAFVPSFHYALPLARGVAFGFSMVAPFGLSTEWTTQSPVRYAATFTELLTTNVSPELAVRLSDTFAFGAALDLQYAQVKFNRLIGAPTLLNMLGTAPTGLDSVVYNKGRSIGVGFHAGVMGMFNENHTRVGLNYQSQMHHEFTGFSRLSGPMAFSPLVVASPASRVAAAASNAQTYNGGLYSNNIDLPNVVTLSGYHDLNERFALLGSVVYTGWNSFKTIQLNGVAAASVLPTTQVVQVFTTSISEQHYRDAWRFALGANYNVNEQWLLRVGGGYDQTPTRDAYRDVRLPDSDRWALSIGGHYQMNPHWGFDLGYTHLFGTNSSINSHDILGTSTYSVNASTDAAADLLGFQVVWNIDVPAPVAPMKA